MTDTLDRKADLPQPIVVSRLRKRKTLSPSELLWVYNAPISFLMAGVFAVAFLATIALDPAVGILGFIISVVVMVIFGILTNDRTKAERSNSFASPRESKFNFRGRRHNCFYERNRKLAAHADERLTRLKELRGKYKQYSVWIDYDRKEITMRIMEHEPWFRLFGAVVYAGETHMLGHTSGNDELFKRSQGKAEVKVKRPTLKEVEDIIAQMERRCQVLEQRDYDDRLEELQVERIALMKRRPPENGDLRAVVLEDEKKALHG